MLVLHHSNVGMSSTTHAPMAMRWNRLHARALPSTALQNRGGAVVRPVSLQRGADDEQCWPGNCRDQDADQDADQLQNSVDIEVRAETQADRQVDPQDPDHVTPPSGTRSTPWPCR